MSWLGAWKNQYGSIVDITDESGGRIAGSFRTAIENSPFYGADVPITGVHKGAAIAFVCAAENADFAVSYTGKLEDGRMETLWFVVDGDADWWKSTMTNHDTFERIGAATS
jgi:hypothetical protein